MRHADFIFRNYALALMRWNEFQEKWGKPQFKLAAKLVAAGHAREFAEDLLSLPPLFELGNKYTILVRDSNTAAKLIGRVPSNFNILATNYISAVEDISSEDLKISELENYSGICLFMYEDTPEAEVTKSYIKQRFPNIQFLDIRYGISAKDPAGTDDYTLIRTISDILNA